MNKTALVTGAAKRIGSVIAKTLHAQGFNIVLHYQQSKQAAEAMVVELNSNRSDSAIAVQGDISQSSTCKKIIETAYQKWQRLDVLVNNASSFYPTPVNKVDEQQWEDLLGSNLKGPFFLSQAAHPYLDKSQGAIINIVDIHADRPLKNFPVYSIAKAGLVMLTKSLARELAPNVRVNAVAPGVILWPNEELPLSPEIKQQIIERTCLKRQGTPSDIANTVLFLIQQPYITGQVVAVDGGRSIKD